MEPRFYLKDCEQKIDLDERNARIVKLFKQKTRPKELAEIFGMTRTNILIILRKNIGKDYSVKFSTGHTFPKKQD